MARRRRGARAAPGAPPGRPGPTRPAGPDSARAPAAAPRPAAAHPPRPGDAGREGARGPAASARPAAAAAAAAPSGRAVKGTAGPGPKRARRGAPESGRGLTSPGRWRRGAGRGCARAEGPGGGRVGSGGGGGGGAELPPLSRAPPRPPSPARGPGSGTRDARNVFGPGRPHLPGVGFRFSTPFASAPGPVGAQSRGASRLHRRAAGGQHGKLRSLRAGGSQRQLGPAPGRPLRARASSARATEAPRNARRAHAGVRAEAGVRVRLKAAAKCARKCAQSAPGQALLAAGEDSPPSPPLPIQPGWGPLGTKGDPEQQP
ncbi:collagen alpha-1(I) chain-like [Mustela lutreola]|uniref:collagen alpha-1(I) chain-like n=1 Tax=Mustela lutreola TaxID=9666 RepID=UPI0027974674|nr:collagen alpha-1(I) chain-like [Mustela lutreola]